MTRIYEGEDAIESITIHKLIDPEGFRRWKDANPNPSLLEEGESIKLFFKLVPGMTLENMNESTDSDNDL